MVRETRRLQLQHPDETIFAAVLVPVLQDGPRRLPARCKLDTGSDVSLIDQKLLIDAGLQSLVEDIPVEEQQEIQGVMGFRWNPKQRITLKFYLINSLRMRSIELFLCEDLDLDVLISNRYFEAIRAEEQSNGRILWLSKVRQTSGISIQLQRLFVLC